MKDSNDRGASTGGEIGGKAADQGEHMEQRTPPTPSGETDVLTGLQRVRRTARERKQERFTTLLHHVTVDLLRESFAS